MLINRGDGEDGILSNVCMAVLKTRPGRREERLDKLGLAELAEEA